MTRLKALVEQTEGFTLLELIVVAAVIALISSIILVSVQQSQKNAEDQAIIRDLDQVRKEAESFYVKHGGYEDICASDGSLTEEGYFGELESSIKDKGGEIKCEAGVAEFAVSVSLQEGDYWCVDSRGISQEVDQHVSDTSCP